MPTFATVLLTHERPDAVARMCRHWLRLDPEQHVIVAYGGERSVHAELAAMGLNAVHVADPELRTKDHPRERQSYSGVFRTVLPLIRQSGASHVHFAEYDEIPLVEGLSRRLLNLLETERADVIGHRLERVDGTSHPHYTSHRNDPAFHAYWRSFSRREDKDTVLSMLGCGSFWKREAFEAVAELTPPLRIYLELMLPTAAHHLGFRVRPCLGQDRFMAPEEPKSKEEFEDFRREGALRIHPVKGYWQESP